MLCVRQFSDKCEGCGDQTEEDSDSGGMADDLVPIEITTDANAVIVPSPSPSTQPPSSIMSVVVKHNPMAVDMRPDDHQNHPPKVEINTELSGTIVPGDEARTVAIPTVVKEVVQVPPETLAPSPTPPPSADTSSRTPKRLEPIGPTIEPATMAKSNEPSIIPIQTAARSNEPNIPIEPRIVPTEPNVPIERSFVPAGPNVPVEQSFVPTEQIIPIPTVQFIPTVQIVPIEQIGNPVEVVGSPIEQPNPVPSIIVPTPIAAGVQRDLTTTTATTLPQASTAKVNGTVVAPTPQNTTSNDANVVVTTKPEPPKIVPAPSASQVATPPIASKPVTTNPIAVVTEAPVVSATTPTSGATKTIQFTAVNDSPRATAPIAGPNNPTAEQIKPTNVTGSIKPATGTTEQIKPATGTTEPITPATATGPVKSATVVAPPVTSTSGESKKKSSAENRRRR